MKKITLPLLVLLLAVNSCKKDPKLDPEEQAPTNKEYEWVDATVSLPDGVNYSLAGHELNAVGEALAISDNDLLQVIFDNLVEKLDADYTKEYEIVLSWNEARRSIYLIWLLQAEVNNGGHNQFYYNSSGQFYEYLPNALRLVGAQRHAELMERANAIYEREYNRITEHLDGTIEGFSKSYDDNPLNPLDDEFYKLEGEEDLFALQVAYIRAHKEAFADTST